jgi:hypothetical protein
MTYFFDNCISPCYAKMLSALGVEATALRDLFQPDIEDDAMFRELKDKMMVFVSANRKQQTRKREYLALKEAQVTAIWFGSFADGN